MMGMRQWTIGSSLTCDLLVDSPTVSATHCRISQTNAGFQIADLGSSNGTMVDGQRIRSLTSITPSSRVTLGADLPLPWPDAETAARTISIGRGEENDCVLTKGNVSTNHARLIVGRLGTLVIEDLGSTNGTWITPLSSNKPDLSSDADLVRIKRIVAVQPNQTVFLGSTEVRIADILSKKVANDKGATQRSAPVQALTAVDAGSSQPQTIRSIPFQRFLLPLIGTVAAVLVMIALANGRSTPEHDIGKGTAGPNRDSPDTTTLPTSDSDKPAVAPSSPFDALYWVVIRSGTPKLSFRLGTAWSPDGKVLVTSAGVVEAMKQQLQKDGGADSEALVVHGATKSIHGIVAFGTHHEFPKRLRELEETSQMLTSKLAELRDPTSGDANAIPAANEGEPEKAAQTIKQAMQDLVKKQFDQTQAVVCYDVAWLRLGRPPATPALKLATDTQVRPKQKCRIAASGFDMEDPYYDDSTLFQPDWTECRVESLIQPPGTSQRQLLANSDLVSESINFFGAPILNDKNEVVSMFVRSTNEQLSEAGVSTGIGAQVDGVLPATITEMMNGI